MPYPTIYLVLLGFFLFMGSCSEVLAQKKIDYNTEDNYMAEGYDVVAYFSKKAVEGSSKYVLRYDGVFYKFSTAANKAKFKANPKKYVPQYGGWCAYAMGSKGEKVSIDPETFEIRGGKLYLFYNAYFNNTLNDWLEEGPEKLKKQADRNWAKIKYSKS